MTPGEILTLVQIGAVLLGGGVLVERIRATRERQTEDRAANEKARAQDRAETAAALEKHTAAEERAHAQLHAEIDSRIAQVVQRVVDEMRGLREDVRGLRDDMRGIASDVSAHDGQLQVLTRAVDADASQPGLPVARRARG